MRARTIAVIMAMAVGLGLLTGRYVLPARSAAAAGAEPPGDGSTAPRPPGGRLTQRSLLTAADFAGTGISRPIHVRDRVGDGRYANAACAGEKTLGQTLGGPAAYFRGLMTGTRTDGSDTTLAADGREQVAREVAADAGSPQSARNFTERLLLEEEPCQQEPAAHWVYGPTHTVGVAAGVTASWLGSYAGELNTAGSAPGGREPCGGIAILLSGSHYAVLEIDACLDTAAMTRIVRTAVTRL